jgi:inosine-uridine nucleoside N-ribohydrolase
VGGVANPLSFRRRLSNLNIHRDRAAASLVLSQWRSSYQFPLDVIDQLCIGDAELEALKSTGAIGSYLALNSQDWLRTSWLRHGRNQFPVWDLVAALGAIGHLPTAGYDERHRLIHFDSDKAWQEFLTIIQPPDTAKLV